MVKNKKFTHELEKRAIKEALQTTKGNLNEAAKLLNMPQSTFQYKIRILDLLLFARALRAKATLEAIEK